MHSRNRPSYGAWDFGLAKAQERGVLLHLRWLRPVRAAQDAVARGRARALSAMTEWAGAPAAG